MSKVGIILQARMGSKRLPGKVLKNLLGRPMIAWSLENLNKVRSADLVVVATSSDKQDDILADWLLDQGIEYFRGSESDVLDRYYECAKKYAFTDIVRATGDNPLVDHESIDQLISTHLRNKNDYTAMSSDLGGKLPIGVGSEIFTFESLEKSWKKGLASNHREHVNEYVQENRNEFKTEYLISNRNWSDYPKSVTVDTLEDFKAVEAFISKLKLS